MNSSLIKSLAQLQRRLLSCSRIIEEDLQLMRCIVVVATIDIVVNSEQTGTEVKTGEVDALLFVHCLLKISLLPPSYSGSQLSYGKPAII